MRKVVEKRNHRLKRFFTKNTDKRLKEWVGAGVHFIFKCIFLKSVQILAYFFAININTIFHL